MQRALPNMPRVAGRVRLAVDSLPSLATNTCWGAPGLLCSRAAALTVLGLRAGGAEVEVELMPLSARLVTLTIGMRFLTDYLAGDMYFKISRPKQNLERARVQFKMVRCMEAQAEAMKAD